MTVSQTETRDQAHRRKEKVGRVVSDRMDKTIVVSVERLSRHRVYKRVIRLTTKFKAHDEENEARIGDTVRIEESRPLSATKRWRLVEIVQRGGEGAGEPILAEEEATSEVIHMAAHPGRHDPTEVESDVAGSTEALGASEAPIGSSDADRTAAEGDTAEADTTEAGQRPREGGGG